MYPQALLILGLFTFTGSAFTVPKMLGIDPKERKYFESSRILCKDGSKTFSRDRLNDDFCDCADGTDEPGTSACPEGKFYCTNTGNKPVRLFSSQVNDGICDCCDGSDEYYGRIRCPNKCRKTGKWTDQVSEDNESFTLKKQGREHARQKLFAVDADSNSFEQDNKELKGIIQKIKELKLLPLFELVLVASILACSQGRCCRRRHAHPRRRRRI